VPRQPLEKIFFCPDDRHPLGFEGPPNPEAQNTLRKAVAAVNSLERQPDFIMFTGDLTHAAADEKEALRRMTEFKAIVSELKVKDLRFIPGENDTGLDNGEMYQHVFGTGHYSFNHKGIHFVALDNVSDPNGLIGESNWNGCMPTWHGSTNRSCGGLCTSALFDLYPPWDWATKDGAKAIDILTPYQNTTVFFGHIHQEHHQMTGHIAHHAAESLIFSFPLPGSQPRTPSLGTQHTHSRV
jgi:3',5'-cyclic AMP phosphodiesterase CpdA